MLNNLGRAYGPRRPPKKRDWSARSLSWNERRQDQPNVAVTLTNLGNAWRPLGDQAKKRDMLERALAINERTYGRDHKEVAITLMNLGVAYGKLGRQREGARRAGARARDSGAGARPRPPECGHHAGAARGRVRRFRRPREGTRHAGARARDPGAGTAATTRNWPPRWRPRERVRPVGDHAKARDMLERALAISEQSYDRDHVAITLYDLGNHIWGA